jgi:hypothetical protein
MSFAKDVGQEKSSFLAAATQALRDRTDKPLEQFQAYFLAIFADKDYAKVLNSLAKVDKALGVKQPERACTSTQPVSVARNPGRAPMICYYCGAPGHISPFCYKKRAHARRGRFSPYPQRGRERGNFS